MPCIEYVHKTFRADTLKIIDMANSIIATYEAQGFSLTLRQLYYQFVARDALPNTEKDYKRLGTIINNARLAGLVDWNLIVDRTRNLEQNSHWNNPADILEACEKSYREDKWATQIYYPEVWIEKEALIGIVEGVCKELDIPYFACRGYSSQSEQWRAGVRFAEALTRGQIPIVFHLGDHDPSGVDMTRDNQDRLTMFAGQDVTVDRLALNMDQIEELNPPPNPTKFTDVRASAYVKQHGINSWELDALEPSYIVNLIEDAVLSVRDQDLWNQAVDAENESIDTLRTFRAGLNIA